MFKVRSRNNQSRMKNDSRLYVNNFEQVQLLTVSYSGGSDALKVIKERCIATWHNVAKVSPPITLNKS